MHMVYKRGISDSVRLSAWQDLVSQWHESGMLGRAYCQSKGLNYYDLTKWDYFFNKLGGDPNIDDIKELPVSDFIEVEFEEVVESRNTNSETSLFKLEHTNGFTLHIPQEVEPSTLQQLIKAIGEASC